MLRFIRPALPPPEQWLPYLGPAYQQNQYSNFGPVHEAFEERLTADYGSPFRRAVLVASGTAGITATLMALGIRGRVLLPSFTFPASLQAVRAAGCAPVFADVCGCLWEMSAETLQTALVRQDVDCVMAVRSYGLCRDLSSLEDVCRQADVPLIVDAAAALGGALNSGMRVGGQGTAEIFSLHATKVFGVGEGGVVFAPEELCGAIRTATNFGIANGRVGNGFNGKLSEFACAVGLAVADRMPCYLATRRRIAEHYFKRLLSHPGVRLPCDPGHPPWQTFPLQLTTLEADQFIGRALSLGLEVRPYYRPALHTVDSDAAEAPVSERLARSMVCLPVYSDMTDSEQNAVLNIVETALEELSPH